MLHFCLVEKHHDELLARCLVVDDKCLVLNVRAETPAVDLDCGLRARENQND